MSKKLFRPSQTIPDKFSRDVVTMCIIAMLHVKIHFAAQNIQPFLSSWEDLSLTGDSTILECFYISRCQACFRMWPHYDVLGHNISKMGYFPGSGIEDKISDVKGKHTTARLPLLSRSKDLKLIEAKDNICK